MNNVCADPAYAETLENLKTELLQVKKEVGDTDEGYPALMEARAESWD